MSARLVALALLACVLLSVGPASASAQSGTISNSREGEAILKSGQIGPGDSLSGRVTIRNAGNGARTILVETRDVRDTAGSGGGKLSAVLELTIDDADGGRTYYRGTIGSMPRVKIGEFDEDEARELRFTARFPDTASDQNSYQGASLSAAFVWGDETRRARDDDKGGGADPGSAGGNGQSGGGSLPYTGLAVLVLVLIGLSFVTGGRRLRRRVSD